MDFDNPPPEPLAAFADWMAAAQRGEPSIANAAALATIDGDGVPNLRMVLIKQYDERGFVFYGNADSRKGQDIAACNRAALCLHWKSLHRQIRLRGMVAEVEGREADAYFTSRDRQSQLSAWASKQSATLDERADLEQAMRHYEDEFSGQAVPRPPFWCGWRLLAKEIEFWQDREHRLHDRLIYHRMEQSWQVRRLYP